MRAVEKSVKVLRRRELPLLMLGATLGYVVARVSLGEGRLPIALVRAADLLACLALAFGLYRLWTRRRLASAMRTARVDERGLAVDDVLIVRRGQLGRAHWTPNTRTGDRPGRAHVHVAARASALTLACGSEDDARILVEALNSSKPPTPSFTAFPKGMVPLVGAYVLFCLGALALTLFAGTLRWGDSVGWLELLLVVPAILAPAAAFRVHIHAHGVAIERIWSHREFDFSDIESVTQVGPYVVFKPRHGPSERWYFTANRFFSSPSEARTRDFVEAFRRATETSNLG